MELEVYLCYYGFILYVWICKCVLEFECFVYFGGKVVIIRYILIFRCLFLLVNGNIFTVSLNCKYGEEIEFIKVSKF